MNFTSGLTQVPSDLEQHGRLTFIQVQVAFVVEGVIKCLLYVFSNDGDKTSDKKRDRSENHKFVLQTFLSSSRAKKLRSFKVKYLRVEG